MKSSTWFLSLALGALHLCAASTLHAQEGSFFLRQAFKRGDFNGDGNVDISDAVVTFGFLFLGDPPSDCENAADSNADRSVDISDGISTLNFLFGGAAPPPAPGPTACGPDPSEKALPCAFYPACPSHDIRLIVHALNRITFGPTEDLLSRIQTREQLIEYIEEQLQPPESYDPAVHEPDLAAQIEALDIGFDPAAGGGRGLPDQSERLKAMVLLFAKESRWQLLQVLTQFWNNHFHTQLGALRNNYWGRGPVGGSATRASPAQFDAADRDDSGALTRGEWSAFRQAHAGAIPWELFRAAYRSDGVITLDEYLQQRNVAGWKYWFRNQQLSVCADMEKREFDFFQRHALGSFRDLIEGSAKSPAQVVYLNNFENTVRAPNENYAREFLELFTVGVDHVYTQRDIEEIARVFTGWNVGWVRSAPFAPGDLLFVDNPDSQVFPLNRREPDPFLFPTQEFWDDDLYTWAFVFGARNRAGRPLGEFGHDWGEKNILLPEYGGVDSLGNPAAPDGAVVIPAVPASSGNRTVSGALGEFDRVLDRVVDLRDTAKFVSTKLIQLFVTDDLEQLAKTRTLPDDLRELFDAVDLDGNGTIEVGEWEEATFELPNGRPPDIFDGLDADGDGRITPTEYQEPDLLLAAIQTWQRTGGDLREVVRTILLSEEFLSLKFYRAKVKTPLEVVASASRALNGTYDPRQADSLRERQLLSTIDDVLLAGMELFDFADPTGESELGFDWMHTVGLLERLKYLNRAANPRTLEVSRLSWSPGAFRSRWELTDAERTVDFFSLLLFGRDILDHHTALAIDAYEAEPVSARRLRAAVAYLLSLPQFQLQ